MHVQDDVYGQKEEVSTLSLISNILDVILRANRNKR